MQLSMKNKVTLLLAIIAALGLSNCTTTTRVVEVTPVPVVKPKPKVVYKPAPKPPTTPDKFKVVNQYDEAAR